MCDLPKFRGESFRLTFFTEVYHFESALGLESKPLVVHIS